ncbi:MAG: hypothetical protein JNL88_08965 [Bacteroidia bacterium]|nr:hypothetical protein [Bacteroidia bacterium]
MSQKLLERQIHKHLGELKDDPRVVSFLNAVASSYSHYERDRILMERAMLVSSEEYQTLIRQNHTELEKLKSAARELIDALKLLNIDTKNSPDLYKDIQVVKESIKRESLNRKQAERKQRENLRNLEKINRDLDQFAYVVSHDLKAPLRAISSLAEWIEEDSEGKISAETKNNLQLLRGRVNRMENLIHGILAYTKADKIKGTTAVTNTELYLKEIIDLLNPPQHIQITMEGEWPTIETDTVRLHQVLINLLSNAIKYNDKDQGIIITGCVPLENCCQFYVEDNGPGIEDEYHQRIFVLFQTLSTRDEVESTGIGLSIVKKIVEEQGGKIWIDSKVGKGTRFTFTWPHNNIILENKAEV